MLSPFGRQLSNDSMCESMLSCFKICFEARLSGTFPSVNCVLRASAILILHNFYFIELLKHSAEQCLKDIVQLLFRRLPLFDETLSDANTGNYKVCSNYFQSILFIYPLSFIN